MLLRLLRDAFRRPARRPAGDAAGLLAEADQLEARRDLAGAVQAYRAALAAAPANAVAWNNLGWALQQLDDLDGAREAYEHALGADPGLVIARNNLGTVHRLSGDLDGALRHYRTALAAAPRDALAHLNLGTVLLKQGEASEAIGHFRTATGLDPGNDDAERALLLALNYAPAFDRDEAFRRYREWGAKCAARVQRLHPRRDASPDRRLRIGYVSPDFRAHAVAGFIEPALEHHDPAVVEVYCYDNSPQHDAVSERLQGYRAQWRDIRRETDDAVARRIEADAIDILVDLAGHTVGHRLELFARHPAPVQASLLGYLNTTGLGAMDYRITDAVCDPPGVAERFHLEEPWRLPGSFWCWHAPDAAPEPSPLPSKSTGFVTFGSFNNVAKLNREVTSAWIDILARCPGSRLLVAGAPEGSARERFVERFTSAGIDASRIRLVGRVTTPAFQRLHQEVDVALDAFPYSGGATTCESLWMGVPVVTLAGALGFERSATGILTTLGLEDLIARDRTDYVDRACALAADTGRLPALRGTLRPTMQRSPLLDGRAFAARLEDAYRGMWQRWCARAANAG